MKDLPVMGKGDLLQIDWVDIFENSVGDPRTAKLARRTSFGLLWEVGEDEGVPVIVTTTTIDKDPGQEGFCIYPTSCITEVQVVKKARRNRRQKGVGSTLPQPEQTHTESNCSPAKVKG